MPLLRISKSRLYFLNRCKLNKTLIKFWCSQSNILAICCKAVKTVQTRSQQLPQPLSHRYIGLLNGLLCQRLFPFINFNFLLKVCVFYKKKLSKSVGRNIFGQTIHNLLILACDQFSPTTTSRQCIITSFFEDNFKC